MWEEFGLVGLCFFFKTTLKFLLQFIVTTSSGSLIDISVFIFSFSCVMAGKLCFSSDLSSVFV